VGTKTINDGGVDDLVEAIAAKDFTKNPAKCGYPWNEFIPLLREHLDRDSRIDAFRAYCEEHDYAEHSVARVVSHAMIYRQEKASESAWPILHDDARYGPFWDIVQRVMPDTEADEVPVLLAMMVLYGNLIGRTAYTQGGEAQHTNEFLLITGASAIGRKGTAYGVAIRIMAQVDEEWRRERVTTGVSSGEALIDMIRDPRMKQIVLDEKGADKLDEYGKKTLLDKTEDLGVPDKRLVWWCSEFARIMNLLSRSGNTLGDILREGWDGGMLENNVRTNPSKVRSPHVSLISAVTPQEVQSYFSATEMANGFANRFLWCMSRRSKNLPEGGGSMKIHDDLLDGIVVAKNALRNAAYPVEFYRDREAQALWAETYARAVADRPGMYGTMSSRSTQHMIRLQVILAVADQSYRVVGRKDMERDGETRPRDILEGTITAEHVRAARGIWRYCAASLRYLWGTTAANPLADMIYQELSEKKADMTTTEIHALFGNRESAVKIREALKLLQAQCLVGSYRGTRAEGDAKGGNIARHYVAIPSIAPKEDF